MKLRMEPIFTDTNVIIWLLKGKENVIAFFANNMGCLVSNIIVYLEVMHVIRRLSQKLHRPLDLTPVHEVFENLALLPIDGVSMRRVSELVEHYNLMPNDAMIAATCEHYKIKEIATYDEDFSRLNFLKVITP